MALLVSAQTGGLQFQGWDSSGGGAMKTRPHASPSPPPLLSWGPRVQTHRAVFAHETMSPTNIRLREARHRGQVL